MGRERIEYEREPVGIEVRVVLSGHYGITNDGRLWRYPRRNKREPGWLTGTGTPVRYYLERHKPMALASRLVAEAWLPNPDGLKFVRFKDGNPDNIHVNNLYWSKTTGGGRNKRQVFCVTTGITYGSIKEAGLDLGIAASQISAHLAGKLEHAKSLTFRYVNQFDHPKWRQKVLERRS